MTLKPEIRQRACTMHENGEIRPNTTLRFQQRFGKSPIWRETARENLLLKSLKTTAIIRLSVRLTLIIQLCVPINQNNIIEGTSEFKLVSSTKFKPWCKNERNKPT